MGDNNARTINDGCKDESRQVILYCVLTVYNNNNAVPNNNAELVSTATVTPTASAVYKVCHEFKQENRATFEEMLRNLNVTEENAAAAFEGVLNELFCEGITWNRITAFVTFASFFAFLCREKRIHSVSSVVGWTNAYCERHLLRWITDHGGWGGFIQFFNLEEKQDTSSINLKKLFCGVAAGALGAITVGAFLASKS